MTALFTSYSLIANGTFTASQALRNVALRWLRFGPPLIALMAIDFVWPLFGSGPMFTELSAINTKNCINNALPTALMVNNWSTPMEMCLVHTWCVTNCDWSYSFQMSRRYISAEFQLFVIGMFAMWLLGKKPTLGVAFCYSKRSLI